MITYTAEVLKSIPEDIKPHVPEGTEVVNVMMSIPIGYGLLRKMTESDLIPFKIMNEKPVKDRLKEFFTATDGPFTEVLSLPGDPSFTFPLLRVRGDRLGGGDLTVNESRKGVFHVIQRYFDTYDEGETVRMVARVQTEPEAFMLLVEEIVDEYKSEVANIIRKTSE